MAIIYLKMTNVGIIEGTLVKKQISIFTYKYFNIFLHQTKIPCIV
jgi:hypothetical protein